MEGFFVDHQIAKALALQPQHGFEFVRRNGDIIIGIVEQGRWVGVAAHRVDVVQHAAGKVAGGLKHQMPEKMSKTAGARRAVALPPKTEEESVRERGVTKCESRGGAENVKKKQTEKKN